MPELEATPGGAIYLAGPTAVGKSRLALEIARQLGGEMISVDSMQVYQGLDIGTAKASASDQDEVPHHLIDIVPLDHPFDVQQFLTRTADVIPGIKRRQHVPIFCGGTGLYFKAFLEGLDPLPPPDPALAPAIGSAGGGAAPGRRAYGPHASGGPATRPRSRPRAAASRARAARCARAARAWRRAVSSATAT